MLDDADRAADGPGASGSESPLTGLRAAAREGWMSENRAAAHRFVACYELFLECQRQGSGAGGDECRPGYEVVDPIDVATGYVVAAMAISSRRAVTMISFAFDLHTRYPAILTEMTAGRLDQRAAEVLASQMATVHVDVLNLVQQQVVDEYLTAIEGGIRLGEKAIRSNVDAIIADHDANGIRLRRQEAARTRGVRVNKGIDGMSSISAILATEEAAVLADALDQRVAAHRAADAATTGTDGPHADAANVGGGNGDGGGETTGEVDDYSLAERRADALISLVCGDVGPGGARNGPGAPARPTQPAGAGAGAAPLRPKVTVIATGNHALDDGGARVEFTRTGQAALQALLDMLATCDGAGFERIDPRIGAADDARAALRYRPGTDLARRIRLRDGTCRHPGCTVPAEACDLDHVVPFDHTDPSRGGPTTEANLAAMCRRHHRFKTFSDWRYDLRPDGALTVTTPEGSTMLTRPSGPLADYRREQADTEASAWRRQQRRTPRPTNDERADAEPTFWSRRAARHRTERHRTAHRATTGTIPTAPAESSRWWNRNAPRSGASELGIRTLLLEHHRRCLDDILDPPPF